MKQTLRMFVLVALFSFCGSGLSWAGGGGDTTTKQKATFYSKATATASPTGSGKVYISANTAASGNIAYEETKTLEYNREDEGSEDAAPTKATHKYYFYAQPEEGYIFNRWMLVNNSTGKTSQASLDNPYTRNITTTALSQDEIGTSAALCQLQAEFIPTPALQAIAGDLASVPETKIYNSKGSVVKDVKAGDKVTLKTDRMYMGTGMGKLRVGRSAIFDGWYNKTNELISDQESFEFVVPENYDKECPFLKKVDSVLYVY